MERVWLKHYDPGVSHTIDYPANTLHGLPEETARKFPEETAIIFPGALGDAYRLNYRQLNRLVDRLANALIRLGVKKGERVRRAGVSPVPISP